MQMSFFDLISKAHSLFRYGVPRPRDRYILIPTDAHFIVFDTLRVGPAYTMHRITPGSTPKLVDRDDDFISELTLPDELQTTTSHYSQWNQEHPDDPMDKGHQTGSQFRRANSLVQHDVDSLAGCCPETPRLNQIVKRSLEMKIAQMADMMIDVRSVQGPVWFGDSPRGKLASGQWIPDALFISVLMRPNHTRIQATSWIMDNQQRAEDINLREVSLNELEAVTGYVFWDQVRTSTFQRQRSRIHGDNWWK
jgi:DNA/RNA endonuclease G (NUC1)